VIPEAGKRVEDSRQSAIDDGRHVFEEDERCFGFVREAHELIEKTAALSRQARSKSCNANVLAGKAAKEKVDGPA
jgi:hypothetical protein